MSHIEVFFSKQSFQFLLDLRFNNDRRWFQENKVCYEEFVKHPIEAFAQAFPPRLAKLAPNYDQARVFRIQRDTRFSMDKTPYKTHASIQFLRAGADRDAHQPGFYVHIEPGESFVGAGIWAPEPAVLERIRAAIIAKPTAWAPLSKFPLWGDSYIRPPRDVDPDHRFIDDLKRKHFLTWVDFKDKEVFGPTFIDRVEKACRQMAPLVVFLDKALGLGRRASGR